MDPHLRRLLNSCTPTSGVHLISSRSLCPLPQEYYRISMMLNGSERWIPKE